MIRVVGDEALCLLVLCTTGVKRFQFQQMDIEQALASQGLLEVSCFSKNQMMNASLQDQIGSKGQPCGRSGAMPLNRFANAFHEKEPTIASRSIKRFIFW